LTGGESHLRYLRIIGNKIKRYHTGVNIYYYAKPS
jgi:hypothetical protein